LVEVRVRVRVEVRVRVRVRVQVRVRVEVRFRVRVKVHDLGQHTSAGACLGLHSGIHLHLCHKGIDSETSE